MGHMKDFDRRIRQGGDDAIAAVSEYVGSRWTPVAESVPADHEWVIVACLTGDRYDIGIAKAVRKQVRIGWDSSDIVPRVTHWMPLPEPPEVTP